MTDAVVHRARGWLSCHSRESGNPSSGIRHRARGWLIFLLACAGLIAAAVLYRALQPEPIIPVTERKFYAIVRTVSGLPIPGASVEIRATGIDLSETAIRGETNDAGRVELFYPPGDTVIVRITHPDYAPRTETYVRPTGVRPDDKPLRVTMDKRVEREQQR